MKKLFLTVLSVVMLLCLTACSSGFLSDGDIMNVTEEQNPTVTINLEYDPEDGGGKREVELVFELYYSKAPSTVTNFVQLINKRYYNNKIVHYATGNGGDTSELEYISAGQYYYDDEGDLVNDSVGYQIKGEFRSNQWDANDLTHTPGALAMDRLSGSGAVFDSAATAFYIVLNENVERDGNYCVFGNIVSSSVTLDGEQLGTAEGLHNQFLNDMLNIDNSGTETTKDGKTTVQNMPAFTITITSVTVDTHGIDYDSAKVAKV